MTNLLQPMPMERMVEHVARELEMTSMVFSVAPGYRGAAPGAELPFGRLDLPLGTAPGPHGLLAQGLVSAYVAGARFLSLAPLGTAVPELETDSGGVCRRRERSGGGLGPRQAAAEAVKGSILIGLLCRELGLGDPRGVHLCMALPGERAFLERPEVQEYLDTLQDASGTELWSAALAVAGRAVGRFNNLEREDLDALDPHIARVARVTLPKNGDFSGVELLLRRGLHVLCRIDLSWLSGGDANRALASLAPLGELARAAEGWGASLALEASGSLPTEGEELLSGPFTAPDTLRLAARVAELLPGLPLCYAGGADQLNMARLAGQGFAAVSVCTTLLKPGGYLRLRQLARTLAALRAPGVRPIGKVSPAGLLTLANALEREPHYQRRNAEPWAKLSGKPPVIDCFTAPCQGGCPFGEDIPGALRLMSDGRFRDALQVILDRNPLPHITGAYCHQPCRDRCTRTFYDEAVAVGEAEALCAATAWEDLLARLETAEPLVGQRVAVLGGGVSGMAAAFLFARRGVPVTLFEEAAALGGALRRMGAAAAEAIDLDAQLLDVMEVDVRLGAETPAPDHLLKRGYSHVVDAREAGEFPEGDGEGQLALDEEELCAGDLSARIFVLGDGGEDVPQAIAAAHRVVDGLLGPAKPYPHPAGRRGGAMGKKGKLLPQGEAGEECHRCLECATVCECCVDVCPNRANVPITVLTRRRPQILHQDAHCHACGLCASCCPYEGAPWRDKFTLFETTEAFTRSANDGFVVLDFLSRKVRLRLNGKVRDASLRAVDLSIPGEIQELMETIFTDYPYLLDPNRRKNDDQVTMWP
ncbi:MAG: NAD(P)-binding protein [Oscillospiraceae bacterium]